MPIKSCNSNSTGIDGAVQFILTAGTVVGVGVLATRSSQIIDSV